MPGVSFLFHSIPWMDALVQHRIRRRRRGGSLFPQPLSLRRRVLMSVFHPTMEAQVLLRLGFHVEQSLNCRDDINSFNALCQFRVKVSQRKVFPQQSLLRIKTRPSLVFARRSQ